MSNFFTENYLINVVLQINISFVCYVMLGCGKGVTESISMHYLGGVRGGVQNNEKLGHVIGSLSNVRLLTSEQELNKK